MDYVEQLDLYLDANANNKEFKILNTEDQNLVIHLGLKMFKRGLKDVQLWKNTTWEEKLESLEKSKNKEIDILKENIKTKGEQMREMLVEQKEQLIVIKREVQEQTKCLYVDKISNLNGKIEQLESKLDNEKSKAWEVKESFHQQLTEKMEVLRFTEEEKRDSLRKNYEQLLEKERDKYLTINKRNENSTLLGQDGETFTYHNLNMLFPKSEVVDTHDEKQCGDFRLVYNNMPLLLEVKNYSGNVLKKEISKFKRDMEFRSEMKGGVFISLKSGICAHSDFQMEVYDGRPVIFLTHVKDNMEKIKLAVKFIETVVKEKIDLKNEELVGSLKKLIPSIKRKWNTLKSNVENFKNKMVRDILEQESNVIEIFKTIGMKY
tara:strand:+ start:1284 stop:2414 length:1131 start_codon:yes stop_codon:yes gene_type:complete